MTCVIMSPSTSDTKQYEKHFGNCCADVIAVAKHLLENQDKVNVDRGAIVIHGGYSSTAYAHMTAPDERELVLMAPDLVNKTNKLIYETAGPLLDCMQSAIDEMYGECRLSVIDDLRRDAIFGIPLCQTCGANLFRFNSFTFAVTILGKVCTFDVSVVGWDNGIITQLQCHIDDKDDH